MSSLALLGAPAGTREAYNGNLYAFGFRDNTVTGASMYRSPDELAWEVLGTGNDGPTFGWSATVLANTANPWTWDETNKVQIALTQGTLDSKCSARCR